MPSKGRRPGDAGRWGRSGSRGRGLVTSAPGRLTGKRPAGMMTGSWKEKCAWRRSASFYLLLFVIRVEPTGPARSGRPGDRLRETRGRSRSLKGPSRVSLCSMRATDAEHDRAEAGPTAGFRRDAMVLSGVVDALHSKTRAQARRENAGVFPPPRQRGRATTRSVVEGASASRQASRATPLPPPFGRSPLPASRRAIACGGAYRRGRHHPILHV